MEIMDIEMHRHLIHKLEKQRNQFKAERDTLIDDIAVLRANNKRLERENEHLQRKALGYDKMMTGEIGELYKKAQAFDNYMVDLVKSMETYPHDYLKYNDFEKETCCFYKQDKEDFIKSYENDRRSGHEVIADVEEYDRIIKSLEDK